MFVWFQHPYDDLKQVLAQGFHGILLWRNSANVPQDGRPNNAVQEFESTTNGCVGKEKVLDTPKFGFGPHPCGMQHVLNDGPNFELNPHHSQGVLRVHAVSAPYKGGRACVTRRNVQGALTGIDSQTPFMEDNLELFKLHLQQVGIAIPQQACRVSSYSAELLPGEPTS